MTRIKEPRLSEPALSGSPAILLFDHSKQKLEARARGLEAIGYRVRTASRLSRAKSQLQRTAEPFAFLVIGHPVPESEKMQLTRLYRSHSRDGPIILFYRERVKNSAGAVTLLAEERSPENLLETIKGLNLRDSRG